MMRGTLVPTNRLWRMAREIYGGPVFGESYALTSWIHSGNVDSMMGQASRNSGLILDFLLLKIRPLAIIMVRDISSGGARLRGRLAELPAVRAGICAVLFAGGRADNGRQDQA